MRDFNVRNSIPSPSFPTSLRSVSLRRDRERFTNQNEKGSGSPPAPRAPDDPKGKLESHSKLWFTT